MNTPNQININELAPNASTAMVIGAFAQQATVPKEVKDGALYVVLNEKGGVELLETPTAASKRREAAAELPSHIKRRAVVRDVDSLLDVIHSVNDEVGDYNMQGGSGALEVWADRDRYTITAIHDGEKGWRRHITELIVSPTPSWNDWTAIDGKMLDQVEFAEFIEDHLSSIGEPDGAQLLDICQTLQAHTGVAFKQQAILANGQRAFQWEETVEAKAGEKGNLKIPGELTLVLQPFQGAESRIVKARFRFRAQQTGLLLGVRLVEVQQVIEDAFAEVVADVSMGLTETVNIRFGCP